MNQSRIALVTGGNRGLGRSIALELAGRGFDVVFTYRTGEVEARGVLAEIEKKGRKAHALSLDVSKSETFAAFAGALSKVSKRLDVLVNNAGHTVFASFAETTEAQLDELLDVHVKAPFLLTQRLLPFMDRGSRIVNISSGLTRYSFPGQAAYATAKGALDVLTHYLALELGPRGITANVVAPGGTVTDVGGGAMRDPGLQKLVADDTALGRVGQPDDIGRLVAAIASDDFGWATGQRIEATGGYRV